MVQFRNQEKEIIFKVVYYGPALGGKTTNIETLHKITDPEGKTKVTSLKTAEDRTLFFDLLPFDLGEIQGYHIRIQVYTVPGQVHYNTTRKIVLSSADSVVFVADSRKERLEENYVSWENMKANLLANKMNIDDLPIIIQCNKLDLPNKAREEEIVQKIGVASKYPIVSSSAINGDGVVETFRLAVGDSLARFAEKFKLTQKGITKEKIEESLVRFFEPFEKKRLEEDEKKHSQLETKAPLIGLSEEEQLVAALKSTTDLAEQYNEVERLSKLYEAKLKEMTFLYDVGLFISRMNEGDEIARRAVTNLSEFKPQWIVSLFSLSEDGPNPLVCLGAKEDPLFSLGQTGAGNMALGLFEKKESSRLDDLAARVGAAAGQAVRLPETVFTLFLGKKGNPRYAVLAYASKKEMGQNEKEGFLNLFEKVVSPRIAAMELQDELTKANITLERRVLERTAALSDAMGKLKELDEMKRAFLNSASHEMKTPLTNIKSYSDFLVKHPEKWFDKGSEYLSVIKEESDKLDSLVQGLLSFSHVKEPFKGGSSNLADLIDIVIQTFSRKIKAKKIRVFIQKDKEKIVFPINREDAEVLTGNLVDNAVKFSPEGASIKLFLMEDRNRVIFSVRDYGEGFSEEKRKQFLESPLENSSPVPSLKSGLGLGLYFAREVLKKYGGSIHIDNMNPGANVLIELPKT